MPVLNTRYRGEVGRDNAGVCDELNPICLSDLSLYLLDLGSAKLVSFHMPEKDSVRHRLEMPFCSMNDGENAGNRGKNGEK